MERYYRFSTYFKDRGFKGRVQKVTVDAGFSCPNRDGKISTEGCIYCNNEGFSVNTRRATTPIKKQIEDGIVALKRRTNAEKFIIYFQAFTNTYAPVDELKGIYDSVRGFDNVVGVSIATRPDCVNKDVINLIASYKKDYEVWIEYGIQTIHNKTLEFINRGHLYEDFLSALELTRKEKDIKVCGHVIIGLPFETEDMIVETAKSIGSLKLDGIKIHPLHIIRGTKLEELYNKGRFAVLDMNEYVDLAKKFLEYMWPRTVIQRISADCPEDLLVSPFWILNKSAVLKLLEEKLKKDNTFQGKLYNNVT